MVTPEPYDLPMDIICVKINSIKPDADRAFDSHEYFRAWAAEADVVATQTLTTTDDCGNEESIEMPVVAPRLDFFIRLIAYISITESLPI